MFWTWGSGLEFWHLCIKWSMISLRPSVRKCSMIIFQPDSLLIIIIIMVVAAVPRVLWTISLCCSFLSIAVGQTLWDQVVSSLIWGLGLFFYIHDFSSGLQPAGIFICSVCVCCGYLRAPGRHAGQCLRANACYWRDRPPSTTGVILQTLVRHIWIHFFGLLACDSEAEAEDDCRKAAVDAEGNKSYCV